jgi:S-DNA-T family DNA segregation ATPase FtsK/SpoIIIE
VGKKKKPQQQEQDAYAQAAGAIGGLVIVFAILAAIKDKLGLSWTATVLLVVGVLVALGYLAWRIRTAVLRAWTSAPQTATVSPQGAPGKVAETAEAVPAHPELTAVLAAAGAIGKDQVIRADEATVIDLNNATSYDFLVPIGRTYEHVEKNLGVVAGNFGVTRAHVKLERNRETDRRVKLLKLHEPPFTRPFPAPTRHDIATFQGGVPLGHDVTGKLIGVETFDRASLLVSGMTQTGKTTLINGLITCLLIVYGEFELYLLDGKFCGLTRFAKVATRYESSADPAVFEALLDELNERSDSRYARKKAAIENRQPSPTFKPVIFIVDEAADFFAHDESKEGKAQSRRIANKARSLVSKSLESGISTVLMTQRPSDNAIPVIVRDQFMYRACLYVASSGTAKVALGDTYFDTVAPINPALLDPKIKGQAVLFAHGRSTLIRGFDFADEFVWSVVDEVQARQQKTIESAPETPLRQAIDLMRSKGVEFMLTADLAPALGITEDDATERGKKLSNALGVQSGRTAQGRGYKLADLVSAARKAS